MLIPHAPLGQLTPGWVSSVHRPQLRPAPRDQHVRVEDVHGDELLAS